MLSLLLLRTAELQCIKVMTSNYWTTLAPLKPRLTLASYTGTGALTALIVNLKTAVNTVASLSMSNGLPESEREVTRLVSVPNRQLICRLQAAEWAGWLSDYMQGFTMINGAIVKTLLRIL